MKKKILLSLLLNVVFVFSQDDYKISQGAIESAMANYALCEEPLLSNFCKMYGTLPIEDFGVLLGMISEGTIISNKAELLVTVKKMIEEMDVYFEKKKNDPNYKSVMLASIGDQLMSFYDYLAPDHAYKHFKDHSRYAIAERDNYELSAPEYQKYGRIVNKWRMRFFIDRTRERKELKGENSEEVVKWVKMREYLYSTIPRRIKDSDSIAKEFFDKKKFIATEDYFLYNSRAGRGTYSLTNFYHNYKVPKELYTVPDSLVKGQSYVKVYLDKLQTHYSRELKIKKSKTSAWRRLLTTFPEEKILEDIEKEREKYQEWKRENGK